MDKKDGKVITFYSYKGGTGRSMALANIAWILASNGKKVLVIDWDLEAPGLHRYFAPFLADPELRSTTGFIDFLLEYVDASLTKPIEPKEDWYLSFTDLKGFTTSLINTNFFSNGTLDFVCAGKQDIEYASKVNTFDWIVFYQKLQGGAFLEIVKKQIKKEYDYILIDSRTGVSDTSGICTIQLPDILVACFTYNIQSIDGVSAVINSIINQRADNHISIFPVPTRVDNYEKDRLDRAKEYAQSKLDGFLRVTNKEKYWGSVQVLYQPYYAYEEILATFRDKIGETDSILAKMEIITDFISNGDVKELVSPTEEEKKNVLRAYAQKYELEHRQKTEDTKSVTIRQSSQAMKNLRSGNHVFISYSNTDGLDIAQKVAYELEEGTPYIATWLDKRELIPGNDWDDQIANAIRSCKCLMFVATLDSVNPNSICKNEWGLALKYKKPVIPIFSDDSIELPFRLANRQWISFSSGFEEGIQKLRQNIAFLETDEGLLAELKNRLADAERDLRRAKIEEQTRIRFEIEELEKQIFQQEKIVANPDIAQSQTQKNIESGLERERKPEKTFVHKSPVKYINPPPGLAPVYFQGRFIETKAVADFLNDDAQRLMTVVGRGGVGKTAMVCRLLKGLEGGELPDRLGKMRVEGIVYLSESGSHRVNFANLFYDLCKLLPSDAAQELDAVYKNPQGSTESKMRALLEKFGGGRVVVLLDNFEPLVDTETFAIRDTELDEALRAFLNGTHTAVKVVITTRVAPRKLNLLEPGRQRGLSLDEGLESPYAENILREMDSDGRLGLKSAEAEALNRARIKTRGFPRALEALFAILASDRYTTLDELLTMPLPENVVEALVGEAFNRLDTNAQKVMQALAVYNRPVTPAAVDYLLAPHIPAMDSAPILQRLANMHFARKESGRFYLHPVDREFSFGLIPVEDLTAKSAKDAKENQKESLRSLHASRFNAFTQHDLTSRAADYFAQARKPRAEWKRLEDLSAQLAEFDLRCAAGDYDTAASVLTEIDFGYLLLWGHYRLLIQLQENLQGKIKDSWFKTNNFATLGLGYLNIGQPQKAISYFEQALTLDRANNNLQGEGATLGNLGNSYAEVGEINKSIELFEQALKIAREIGDRRGEGARLGSLGMAYASLGEMNKAIMYHEKALEISRQIIDKTSEGSHLNNLGLIYTALGNINPAIQFFEQALAIAGEIGDRKGKEVSLTSLGNAYKEIGNMDEAIKCFEKALGIANEIGDLRGNGTILGNLGSAYVVLGDTNKAIELYQQALVIARETANRRGEGTIISNIANLYLNTDQYDKSIDFYSTVLQNARAIKVKEIESLPPDKIESNILQEGLVNTILKGYNKKTTESSDHDLPEINLLSDKDLDESL